MLKAHDTKSRFVAVTRFLCSACQIFNRLEFEINKGLFIKMELSWENGNFLHFLKSILSVRSSPRVFYYKGREEGRGERQDSRECEISRLPQWVLSLINIHCFTYISHLFSKDSFWQKGCLRRILKSRQNSSSRFAYL